MEMICGMKEDRGSSLPVKHLQRGRGMLGSEQHVTEDSQSLIR